MASLSIIKGVPLDQEPGIGALTLPGFLREVTTRFADREALVLHTAGRRNALDLRNAVGSRTRGRTRAAGAAVSARTAVSAF